MKKLLVCGAVLSLLVVSSVKASDDAVRQNQPPVAYELKGRVTGKDSSQRTFTLNNSTPIRITDSTYCEYLKHVYKSGAPCFDELQVGWFVEVKAYGTDAIKVERKYYYHPRRYHHPHHEYHEYYEYYHHPYHHHE